MADILCSEPAAETAVVAAAVTTGGWGWAIAGDGMFEDGWEMTLGVDGWVKLTGWARGWLPGGWMVTMVPVGRAGVWATEG